MISLSLEAWSALRAYLDHLDAGQIHNVTPSLDAERVVRWSRGAEMWREFAPHVDVTGARVLSVGVNTGGDLDALLDAGALHVTGIDMMPELIAFTAALLIAGRVDPARWTLRCADVERFETDERFDAVYSAGVLYHNENPLAALRTCFELLKPGGTLALETEVVKENLHGKYPLDAIICWPLREPQYVTRGHNWPTWFIPSEAALYVLLRCVGFVDVKRIPALVAKAAFVARRP